MSVITYRPEVNEDESCTLTCCTQILHLGAFCSPRHRSPRLCEVPLYMLFSSACWQINRQCNMSNPRGSLDWLTDSIRSHCLQKTSHFSVCVCLCIRECVDGGIPFLWNSLESRGCSHGNMRMGISLVTKKKGTWMYWEEWESHSDRGKKWTTKWMKFMSTINKY